MSQDEKNLGDSLSSRSWRFTLFLYRLIFPVPDFNGDGFVNILGCHDLFSATVIEGDDAR
jgi:hypothetical protein